MVGQITDGQALDAFDDAQAQHRYRHQRAGVAGGHGDVGFLFGHGFDGVPHAGVPAAADGLARFFRHVDDAGGVADLGGLCERAMALQQGLQDALVAVQEKTDLGVPAARDGSARKDGGGAGVATHGIN
jgi:hypothetical protein